MPDKVVVLRQDGTRLDVTPEQAERLEVLGYRRETPNERYGANYTQGQENFWTTPEQKLAAGVQGAASGLTLGATDLLDRTDETSKRAEYNPGTRMVTEMLGALVPLALSGGASAAAEAGEAGSALSGFASSPAGLVSRAGEAVAEGGGLGARLGRGAVEGGIFGGAAAADHAYLDDQPITIETVAHGIGMGALFGTGLSAGGELLGAAGRGAASALKAGEAAAVEREAMRAVDSLSAESEYAGAKAAYEASSPGEIEASWHKSTAPVYDPVNAEVRTLRTKLADTTATADAAFDSVMGEIGAKNAQGAGRSRYPGAVPEPGAQAVSLRPLWDKAVRAASKDASATAIADFARALKKIGVGDPSRAISALEDLSAMRAINRELERFPSTIEAFRAMRPERAERVFAALEQAGKLTSVPGASEGVEAAVGQLTQHLGIDGQGVSGLRQAWNASRKMEFTPPLPKKPSVGRAEVDAAGKLGKDERSLPQRLLSRLLSMKVYGAARASGAGKVGAAAAGNLAAGFIDHLAVGKILTNAKQVAQARVLRATARWAPVASKAAAKGPAALSWALDGTEDTSTTDRRQLAANRIAEIMTAAPNAKDTLYKAVAPLDAMQPKLAPALHAYALQAFTDLATMMPRDPGAFSGLKSIYKPSDLEAAVVERQLAVFHDPVGVAESMLATNRFDPISISAMKRFAPAIYDQMRLNLMQRIGQPGVMDKATYRDQVNLSVLLDIPVHSSMIPHNIATSQQMFLDRNQPLPTPGPTQSNPGGRPAGSNPNATQSQKVTDR